MTDAIVGVSIQASDATDAIEQIEQAEAAGIRAAWSTIGGAGGADAMTVFAAALGRTDSILLGTAIVQTWPRHPITIAQQAVALESIAPGRFRLGVGPAHEPAMTRVYGYDFKAPLTNLREYLTVLRSLLGEGEVEFEGRQVTARSRIREPVQTPIMASALRPRSFELCGELADGAISWMCPRAYLVEQALPAVKRGAEAAGRPPPPLIMHVPICVSEDREAVDELARQQLGGYARTPFYLAMFAEAGFPDAADGYSSELLQGLVISGSEQEVAAGLVALTEAGMGEVLAAPIIDPEDREPSIERAFAAVARAGREVN
jgi:F420-dependent oxidoreductase-like protein